MSEGKRTKVLLLDDDEDDFLLTREMLREAGGDRYELLREDSSDDFVTMVCENRLGAAVALVEYRFDSVGGLEVIREINERCPAFACILFTDWPQPEMERMARENGAHGFLRKSDLTGEMLVATIEAVLRYRRGHPPERG